MTLQIYSIFFLLVLRLPCNRLLLGQMECLIVGKKLAIATEWRTLYRINNIAQNSIWTQAEYAYDPVVYDGVFYTQ